MSEQDCVPERAAIKWLEEQLDIARADNKRLRAALAEIDCIAIRHVIEVVQLQPAEDCPGLWIGFRTEGERERAMSWFKEARLANGQEGSRK